MLQQRIIDERNKYFNMKSQIFEYFLYILKHSFLRQSKHRSVKYLKGFDSEVIFVATTKHLLASKYFLLTNLMSDIKFGALQIQDI